MIDRTHRIQRRELENRSAAAESLLVNSWDTSSRVLWWSLAALFNEDVAGMLTFFGSFLHVIFDFCMQTRKLTGIKYTSGTQATIFL